MDFDSAHAIGVLAGGWDRNAATATIGTPLSDIAAT